MSVQHTQEGREVEKEGFDNVSGTTLCSDHNHNCCQHSIRTRVRLLYAGSDRELISMKFFHNHCVVNCRNQMILQKKKVINFQALKKLLRNNWDRKRKRFAISLRREFNKFSQTQRGVVRSGIPWRVMIARHIAKFFLAISWTRKSYQRMIVHKKGEIQ